ncbi:MAG: hypothetical protein GEU71_12995 [Actinobacteria bacterium]|nr:hypothetical protein [Actinomycetota bacterium]
MRLAGAFLLVLAGCTGGDGGPQTESRTNATVYYFDGDALTPVDRELRPGEGLEGVAQSMLAPAPGRLSSALSEVEISEVSVVGDVITVEVDEGFVDASDDEVARRSGQVVYGLTASDLEASVTFVSGAEPIEVITGDGSSTDDPVSRADYARFRPWLEILRPAPGDALATHSFRVEVALREEVDVRLKLEASDRKYYDVVRSGVGIISVPLDVILVGGGTLTVTALQSGVERSLEIPVTFNPQN